MKHAQAMDLVLRVARSSANGAGNCHEILEAVKVVEARSKTKTWRCFHCDQVFRSKVCAELHFGDYKSATPLCQFSQRDFRAMEATLNRYRQEDTDLHRQLRELESKHAAALQRAEESGYDKGLQDGCRLIKAAAA